MNFSLTLAMKQVAIILGTRPEIIKCAPVVEALKSSASLSPVLVSTGQHRELADLASEAFGLVPDINLELMTENQSPANLLGRALIELETTLQEISPVGCIVQGDTTSAAAGALSAFHQQIPIAHIEAGLRTYDLANPFPEEMYRKVVSNISTIHFCPTQNAKKNLENEAITENLHVVGNTVIDAAMLIKDRLESGEVSIEDKLKELIGSAKKVVLVTGHRRENYDGPLNNLCLALRQLVESDSDIHIVFPVHLNPNVKDVVFAELKEHPRIHLLSPVDYPSAIYLIKHCALIVTDSGGIQEEAPSFGTPVLITRKTTERPEGLSAGTSILTPLDNVEVLLKTAKEQLAKIGTRPFIPNPFGDGKSAGRIKSILEEQWT